MNFQRAKCSDQCSDHHTVLEANKDLIALEGHSNLEDTDTHSNLEDTNNLEGKDIDMEGTMEVGQKDNWEVTMDLNLEVNHKDKLEGTMDLISEVGHKNLNLEDTHVQELRPEGH